MYARSRRHVDTEHAERYTSSLDQCLECEGIGRIADDEWWLRLMNVDGAVSSCSTLSGEDLVRTQPSNAGIHSATFVDT